MATATARAKTKAAKSAMPKLDAAPGQDIRLDTVKHVEGCAFLMVKETMDEVYKSGGMRDIYPFLFNLARYADEAATECESQGMTLNMTRGTVASMIFQIHLEETRKALEVVRADMRPEDYWELPEA